MCQNPIDQVREAEQQAEVLLKEAARDAARIVRDAGAQGKLEAENAARAAQTAEDILIQSAHERAEQAFQQAAAQLEEQISALRRKARERQPQAIEAILALIH